jgi:hypothetical protein
MGKLQFRPWRKWAVREAALRVMLNYSVSLAVCLMLGLGVMDGVDTLDASKTQRKYGSSANAFWMQTTASGISCFVKGRISIAILNSYQFNFYWLGGWAARGIWCMCGNGGGGDRERSPSKGHLFVLYLRISDLDRGFNTMLV